MALSVSQIKTFIKSKSEWAGKYILGIWDENFYESLFLGNMCHKYFETHNDDDVIALINASSDAMAMRDELMGKYEVIKRHYQYVPRSDARKENVKFMTIINDIEFLGYVDRIEDEKTIIEFKTVANFSERGDDTIPFWAGMPVWREYELQCWLYMTMSGLKEAKVIEILKKEYKKYTPEQSHKVMEFVWSEERNDEMTHKYLPIMIEMLNLQRQHSPKISTLPTTD